MKNKIYLISLFSLLLVLSVFMISASVTVVSPGASAILSGTMILNASGNNLTNCTFYAKSVSTANSSWSVLGFFSNVSSEATSINGTNNSAILEDASDYIFNATCYNVTADSIHEGLRTGITIDNTVPVAPTLSPSSNTVITSATTQTFTGTVNNARTTGCTYTIYRDGSSLDTASASGTTSYASTSCTFTKTFSSSADNGNYVWTVTATDGKNTTASSPVNFNVQITPGNGGVATDQSGNIITTNVGGDPNPTSYIWNILVIIGIVAIAYYIFK